MKFCTPYLQGVILIYSDGQYGITNTIGEYTKVVEYGSTLSITPNLKDYSFTPGKITCDDVTSNRPNQNFTAIKLGTSDFNSGKDPIKVYPNPTNSELIISQISNLKSQIEIFDVTGRKVEATLPVFQNTNDAKVIDISHLKAGVYFLQTGGEIVKVVKE